MVSMRAPRLLGNPKTSVGNELKPTGEEVDIQPRIFSNEVQIQNYQQLKSLEIYRADGKVDTSVPQPGSSLSTGVILPLNVYLPLDY